MSEFEIEITDQAQLIGQLLDRTRQVAGKDETGSDGNTQYSQGNQDDRHAGLTYHSEKIVFRQDHSDCPCLAEIPGEPGETGKVFFPLAGEGQT